MDLAATYHGLTDAIVAFAGGSDKLVHVHAGMAIYLGAQFLLRTRRASVRALQVLFVAEIANEVMDRLFFGDWRWGDTFADMAATMLWPTASVLVGLYRRRQWAIEQQALRRPGMPGAPERPLARAAR